MLDFDKNFEVVVDASGVDIEFSKTRKFDAIIWKDILGVMLALQVQWCYLEGSDMVFAIGNSRNIYLDI